MWGRVFAQPQTKALCLLLDPLNVSPLVEYRIARTLLADPSPIGIHVVAKGIKVPSHLFRSIKAGFSQAAALLALQRVMCVDLTRTLRLDWFPSFEAAALSKLVAGKWQVGPTSSSSLDLWGELVSKLYIFQKGPHALSQLSSFTPVGLFSNEFALRVASPIITSVWGFIGVSGATTVEGSVAWTLNELHSRAEKIACWTPVFSESRRACKSLLNQAGARAFSDAGIAWSLMLEAPIELAVKPTLFCPPTNGFHSILARCDAILARTEIEIQIEQDKALGRASDSRPPSRPTSPAPSFATSDPTVLVSRSPSSVGPSASQVQYSPSAYGASATIQPPHFSPHHQQPGSDYGASELSSASTIQQFRAPAMQAIPDENGYWCGSTWGGPKDPGNKLRSCVCLGA
jgi:hypothetical protein